MNLNMPKSDGKELSTERSMSPKHWLQALVSLTNKINPFYRMASKRAAESELRRIAVIHKLVLETSRDVVIVCDMEGSRTYISPPIVDMTGWLPKDLIGRPLLENVHPADAAEVSMAIRALRIGSDGGTLEYRDRKSNGRYYWAEGSLRPIRDPASGTATGFLNVVRDITDRKRAEEYLQGAYRKVEALALEDPLTGIANRRKFNESLASAWRTAGRESGQVSLLFIDADYFKKYNDTYGHVEGDKCLKKIAEIAAKIVEGIEDGIVARYGGEEFAVILPSNDGSKARAVAEEIRQAIRNLALPHSGNPSGTVTISIGCATGSPKTSNSCEALIEAADRAVYDAKKAGRDRVISKRAQPRD